MWSAIPDLRSTRALVAVVAAAFAAAAVLLGVTSLPLYLKSYGDTDDAVRLVLVRELLSGRPWYHPEILRLQFPAGGLMHWSRLVDGGIAGLDGLFGLFLSPGRRRGRGPRLVAPAVAAVRDRLGLRLRARPGQQFPRPDCLVAGLLDRPEPAGARAVPTGSDRSPQCPDRALPDRVWRARLMTADRGWRIAALAGIASALGLAVGVEAIFFHAVIALAFALQLLAGREGAAPAARAYGLALAAATIAAFLLQTPPRLWGVSVCDTLGVNLVVAVAAGGLGLAGATLAPAGAGYRAVSTLAAGCRVGPRAYVLLHPTCLHEADGGHGRRPFAPTSIR